MHFRQLSSGVLRRDATSAGQQPVSYAFVLTRLAYRNSQVGVSRVPHSDRGIPCVPLIATAPLNGQSRSSTKRSGPWDASQRSSLTETSATGYSLHIIHVRPNGGANSQYNHAT